MAGREYSAKAGPKIVEVHQSLLGEWKKGAVRHTNRSQMSCKSTKQKKLLFTVSIAKDQRTQGEQNFASNGQETAYIQRKLCQWVVRGWKKGRQAARERMTTRECREKGERPWGLERVG